MSRETSEVCDGCGCKIERGGYQHGELYLCDVCNKGRRKGNKPVRTVKLARQSQKAYARRNGYRR